MGYPEHYVVAPCAFCGKEFGSPPQRPQKHCSSLCRKKRDRELLMARWTRTCGWCGNRFFSPNGKRKGCGKECQQSIRKASRSASGPCGGDRECGKCGKRFDPVALGRGKSRFCSKGCAPNSGRPESESPKVFHGADIKYLVEMFGEDKLFPGEIEEARRVGIRI